VPIQVLLVMLLLDRLMQKKEKEALPKKMNMTIGVFFSEVGTGLHSILSPVRTSTISGAISPGRTGLSWANGWDT